MLHAVLIMITLSHTCQTQQWMFTLHMNENCDIFSCLINDEILPVFLLLLKIQTIHTELIYAYKSCKFYMERVTIKYCKHSIQLFNWSQDF